MSYGVRYKAEFNSVRSNGNIDYTLNILKKDYSGDYQTLYLADNPVVQEWQEDDPKAPIKGCSLKINLLTSNVVNLETFYSEDDTEWMVEFNCPSLFSNQFIGFLVQDDCKELQVGWEHVLELSATDNLGILKKVDFYSAAVDAGISNPKIYLSLLDIIKVCLKATGLTVPYVKVASTLNPNGGSEGRLLEDTFVRGTTFMTNDSQWQNCYDVLEKVMTRFYATCFQANGSWYIIRWAELYQWTGTGATLGGWIYNGIDYSLITNLGENYNFEFLSGNDMETGVLKSIERPYSYVKETFNYLLPQQILCNYNFKEVGTYIGGGIWGGTGTYEDYEMPCWVTYNIGTPENYFIRIIYDSNGFETDRWGAVQTQNYDSSRGVQSLDIEVNAGQSLTYSFDFANSSGVGYPGGVNFAVRLTNGSSTVYLNEDGTWVSTGPAFTFTFNDDLTSWHNVEMASNDFPFDGIVNVFLAHTYPSNSGHITYYRNLNLDIKEIAAGSRQIIGHYNIDTGADAVKNNKDFEIYLDDCAVNNSSGTLFLDGYTNLIRDKTIFWDNGYPFQNRTLGVITTTQELFQRSKTRAKYEGNLLSLIQSTMVTPASVFFNNGNNDIAFVVGSLSINYREEMADITLYELWNKDDNLEAFLASNINEFSYLYEKK